MAIPKRVVIVLISPNALLIFGQCFFNKQNICKNNDTATSRDVKSVIVIVLIFSHTVLILGQKGLLMLILGVHEYFI